VNIEDKKFLALLVALPVFVVGLFWGINIGKGHVISVDPALVEDDSIVSSEQFAPFWKAWSILNEKFVATTTASVEDRVWGSIQGLAGSYKDPYTVFFPPAESKSFQEDISGNFEGVGMEIGFKDNKLIVVAPIKNSPADRAGVKTGDAILSINGTSTADIAVDKAVKLIRGPKGTIVTIVFLPIGSSKTVEKAIVRDVIDIPTIDTSVKPGGVFVIRLYSFTSQSHNLFRQALREFVLSGHHKLILDMRGNPGGYLDSAWDMASWFLPPGAIVINEDFGGKQDIKSYRSKGYDIFNSNLKMIILVDGGSASAAEILAGALSEHGVAELVGTKTFGKGSVQELVPITSETSLKVTVAHWLTPHGQNLSKNGLVPDYEIPLTDKDIQAKQDPQMDKALEILSKLP